MKNLLAITLASFLSIAGSFPVTAAEPTTATTESLATELKSRFVAEYITRTYTVKPASTVTAYAATALGQPQSIILPEISAITPIAPERLRVRFVVDSYPLVPGGVATSTVRVALVDLGRRPPTPDNRLGLVVSTVTIESEETVTR